MYREYILFRLDKGLLAGALLTDQYRFHNKTWANQRNLFLPEPVVIAAYYDEIHI